MGIEEGLYRVSFGTPMGIGDGVAYLAGGKLHGGDSMMAYVGTYSVDGDRLTADVHVFKHSSNAQMVSALGTDDAQLSITASVQGDTVTGDGTAPQAAGMKLSVKLEKLQA